MGAYAHETVRPDVRSCLLKRLATIQEAVDQNSPAAARRAKFKKDAETLRLDYSGGSLVGSINLSRQWNGIADDFAEALARRKAKGES